MPRLYWRTSHGLAKFQRKTGLLRVLAVSTFQFGTKLLKERYAIHMQRIFSIIHWSEMLDHSGIDAPILSIFFMATCLTKVTISSGIDGMVPQQIFLRYAGNSCFSDTTKLNDAINKIPDGISRYKMSWIPWDHLWENWPQKKHFFWSVMTQSIVAWWSRYPRYHLAEQSQPKHQEKMVVELTEMVV